MKYYAIRQIDGVTVNEILTDWNSCKERIHKKRAEYKSFKTEQEALDYLDAYVEEEKEEDVLQNPNNHIYYVDGSCMGDEKIGWGFVYVKDNTVVTTMCGGVKPIEGYTTRNITGELESAKMAVRHALANNLEEIYIINDYQGISSYVTGAWQADKQESKDYLAWMQAVAKDIKINFVKVKGHTNNKFNDMVDKLAKKGNDL